MHTRAWIVEFYNGPTVIEGKAQKPIETVEVWRVYAPAQWAKNHALTLRRQFQGAKIGFSITAF